MRIRIEMAFGLMQMKWGILWRPLRVKLSNIKFIINGIARLHNFTIDERLLDNEVEEFVGVGESRQYLPTEFQNANGSAIHKSRYGVNLDFDNNKYVKGVSATRELMCNNIKNRGLKRPRGNVIVRK